jgi:hypothetical protein
LMTVFSYSLAARTFVRKAAASAESKITPLADSRLPSTAEVFP